MKRRAALALLLAGCTQRTDLLAALVVDGGAAACSGLGAPVRLGGAAAPCAGSVAAATVTRALCSCSSLVLAGRLGTDGNVMGPSGMTLPASVGSDGSIEVGGLAQVAGGVTAGSSDGIVFDSTAAIFGLHSAGSLSATQLVTVGNDAYVAGDVVGRVEVGGTLYVAPDSNVSGSSDDNHIVRQPITIPPPCNCAAGPVLDVPALVAAAASANDDVAGHVDAGGWSAPHGPTSFDLPCGRYYLPSLTSDDTLELRVHGRSALFIGGDVMLAQGLRVTLDAGAELDLLVAGDVGVDHGLLGGAAASSVRLWLASSTLQLGADATLSAVVYAPGALVLAHGPLTVTGALFAAGVATPGDVTVRFLPAPPASDSACQ